MENYIMAIDQGTTSSRCILFDRNGKARGMAQKEFTQLYPQPGWVEHDPLEIWETQRAVMAEAMKQVSARNTQIAAVGITNQRETTIVWDRHTGQPVCPAIVWQCRRTADMVRRMEPDGIADYVRQKTGLVPDAYFSASKVAWILDHVDGARDRAEAGDLLFGTVDTWLIWKLTGGRVHVTDYTNASRTMMYDIHRLCWDDTILSYFHIPKKMLPDVQPSSGIFGYVDDTLPGGGAPISGAAGDQQAALFGQCCFGAGEAKNTYGTGCFLLMNTGETAVMSEHGLLTTIAAAADGRIQYALEGSIFTAGAGVQWLRDELGVIGSAGETERYAASVNDTGGVYLVPAFTGLGAPYWDPYARGTLVGITRGCGKAHLIRAVLESMAYQVSDLLHVMETESGVRIAGLKVDGGASRNDFLMQFQADMLNAEVLRPECIETTALGAAYLAGLAVGYWDGTDDIRARWSLSDIFRPNMGDGERQKLLRGWKRAVACALAWAENRDGEENRRGVE